MKYFVILSAILGAALLYLLSSASANTALFAQNYSLLLGLNTGLAACLLILIGYQLLTLRRKIKAGVFGAKLTVRLVLMFALMALLPGSIVYGVSVQFLSKSIESWFDVRVDNALESGLNLGRSSLDNLLGELRKKADLIAQNLAERPVQTHATLLNTLREQNGVQEAALFTQRGVVISFSSSERLAQLPDRPSAAVMRQVRQQQAFSRIESLPDKGLYLRVVVPVNVLSLSEDIRILQLTQPVPPQLAQDAEAVQTVYRDYQQLSVSRLGLKRLYGLTLTLTLLLALLSAISLAFLLSERLSAPLSILAEGTRAIAKGDFTRMQPVKSRDELGVLTQSFNSMTRQLSEARAAAEQHQHQLENAKGYLESILANLTSGVATFDERFYVRTVNTTASQILGVDLASLRGMKLYEWGKQDHALKAFALEVSEYFNKSGATEWQGQIEYAGRSGAQILLVRGTHLPTGIDNGYVMVFDDISHLIQAQRDAAWGEVARRLAHEIKNPLTPIQLSAERIEHKFMGKLNGPDGDMLKRATQTIVTQVAAMKNMVDSFAEYARAPAADMQNLDLNQLVREVLTLYEALGAHLRLELTSELPSIRGDPTLLRQVLHNLLQNAQDALVGSDSPLIVVKTDQSGPHIRLSITDNGAGFPEHLMPRLFEPYATTKKKGTGLGLAIVKKIVEEHHGMIQVENIDTGGASVCVLLPSSNTHKPQSMEAA